MKIRILIVLIFFSSAKGFASANRLPSDSNIDLKSFSCRDYLLSESSELDLITVFHLGYLHGAKSSRSINILNMTDLVSDVKSHCIDEPDDILIHVFKEKYRNG